MNTDAASKDRQIRQAVVPVSEHPFLGDLFETRKLAEKLTALFKMLPDGGAIAIDSPWGAGKTWFAKNWQLELEKSHGFQTIYIDTFAMDYVEDPFLMLAGELLATAKKSRSDEVEGLLSVGARLGKSLLPVGARVMAGVASKWVLGEVASNAVSDALDEANKDFGEFAERQMRQKLDAYEEEKRTAKAFKEAIGRLTGSLTNPIVVFVDELDRCRPDFAIKTLERIKHFFEVPGLIFVLLVNAKQLAASVRGAYGDDIDAETYLRKFILFSVALPKDRSNNKNSSDVSYCRRTLRSYGFPETESVNSFAEQFGSLATSLHLQYRDIERGCAMFAIGQPIGSSGPLVAWAIALKLWRPTLFERVVNGEKSAHAEVLDSREIFGNSFIVPIALELHRMGASGFSTQIDPEIKRQIMYLHPNLRDERHVFSFLGEKTGVSIQ